MDCIVFVCIVHLIVEFTFSFFGHYVNGGSVVRKIMDESKVFEGAAVLEQLANTHIVPKHFSNHLCASTRDQMFQGNVWNIVTYRLPAADYHGCC